jgi:LytS/YehU family sensor histidine kinase
VGGVVGGYVLGTLIGDQWFGWSSWDRHPAARAQLPISIVVTALAGIAGNYFFYSRARAVSLEKEAQQLQRQAAESKLKLLEAQIEPHMLFNTLANLRVLVQTDAPRATQMLDHLNGYLRSTLSASRQPLHPLADEFARIGDYLALMGVRMGPRLRTSLGLPPDLAQVPVPPLILQPLVENAIQHGIDPAVEGGELRVWAETTGGQLRLVVEDTGVGLPQGAEPPQAGSGAGSGFGLAQVRERLATLYGPQAAMVLEAGRGLCTRSIITIPLQKAA